MYQKEKFVGLAEGEVEIEILTKIEGNKFFLTKVCHAHIRVSKYLHFVHEFWVHHFSQIQCISKFFYFNLVYLQFITRMKYMDKVVKFLKHCLVVPVDS